MNAEALNVGLSVLNIGRVQDAEYYFPIQSYLLMPEIFKYLK
jgi:hypothetical protein